MKPFRKMNAISKYTPKIERMEQHLEENPFDYQTKISLAKLYGKEFEHLRDRRTNFLKGEVARYKREQERKYEKHE